MNIFVGNLHANASEAMLRSLFNTYGEVLSAAISVDKTSTPKGYGYVGMKEQQMGRMPSGN